MAIGVTGVAQLDNMRPLFIAEAQAVQSDKEVAAKLIGRQDLPRHEGTTFNMPYVNAISAARATDGVLFDSPQQITDTNVAFTPSEVVTQILWTARMTQVIKGNFGKLAGDALSGAIEYFRDTEILALYDGFAGIAGAAGTALHHGLIAAAVTAVREGRAAGVTSGSPVARTGARATGDLPLGQEISVVVHERNRYDLSVQYGGLADRANAVTTTTMQSFPTQIGQQPVNEKWLRDHFTNWNINGAQCYVDNNFTIDASDDVKGGVFAREALQMIAFMGLQDYITRTTDGRAHIQTNWVDYAVGEYNDAWGRELYVDAIAVTG